MANKRLTWWQRLFGRKRPTRRHTDKLELEAWRENQRRTCEENRQESVSLTRSCKIAQQV